MKKKALIVLANGFEEIEAFTPIDVLRRAGVEVVIAGLDSALVTGAHGVRVNADTLFDKYSSLPDALVMPGGLPGAENLAKSASLKRMILEMNSKGKLIAAICASPAFVLGPIGILKGKSATCYPGAEKRFTKDVKFVKKGVVKDGNIITGRAPGTAFAFGLKIAEALAGKKMRDIVGRQMLYSYPCPL